MTARRTAGIPARTGPMTPPDGVSRDGHAAPVRLDPAITGALAHLTIADIARLSRTATEPELLERAWSLAGTLVRDAGLGSRARCCRLEIAGAAGVYVRYFLPPVSWTLVGSEVEIDDGRLDLVWATEGAVLYDELKLTAGHGLPTGEGPTRRQAARYSVHGSATYGERFAGVRLVLLGAPRHSQLIGPGAALQRLIDTPFWFALGRTAKEATR